MKAKKILLLVGIVLIVFYAATHPTQAIEAAQTTLSWLKNGLEAIIEFFRSLLDK